MHQNQIILPSTSFPFLPTGLSPSYSDKYPPSLIPYIEKPLFDETIQIINADLGAFWPCLPLRLFAYLCCPCTLGLSLICPYCCIKDAEITVKRDIKRFNNLHEERTGIRLNLKKGCGKSWLEFEIVNGRGGGKGEIEVPMMGNHAL